MKFIEFFPERIAMYMPSIPFVGMISITDPGERVNFYFGWPLLLRLEFHDIKKPVENHVLFCKTHADIILDWLQANEELFQGLYVHCKAGFSRSAAVAMFIADMYEVKNFDYFEADAYNRHVYTILQEALRQRTGKRISPK